MESSMRWGSPLPLGGTAFPRPVCDSTCQFSFKNDISIHNKNLVNSMYKNCLDIQDH